MYILKKPTLKELMEKTQELERHTRLMDWTAYCCERANLPQVDPGSDVLQENPSRLFCEHGKANSKQP